ncbi:MAG: cyclopropane-fatty-acyl-phospholipid synthase [Bacteriovoracaceae bacterium]|nr:cyclopropane-fatty-acyl-phospholipid synthase [Bacteriovoracaceae bacterium]
MPTQLLENRKSFSDLVSNNSLLDKLCKNILLKKLTQLKVGLFTIRDFTQDKEEKFTFGDPAEKDLVAEVIVSKSCFYSRLILGGSIGNAESYVDQDWETNDLVTIVRIFVRNRTLLQSLDSGLSNLLMNPLNRLFHGLRNNSVKGSRKNIHAHYDLGNEFFKLFLDPTMMYSSGIFETQNDSLQTASENKIRIICEKLSLKSSDHLLEIGTGWGSLSIYAAKTYGCKVTTATISQEQYNYAQEQVKKYQLESLVTVLLEDYRHLEGTFDKLVSVEMIEAVGLNYLDIYFEKCAQLLKPEGIMALQAITIRDSYYETAKRSVDFIQRHIFPGSGIPSISAMMDSVKRKTDLVLIQQNDFAQDYAKTLHEWSRNLSLNKDKIVSLGYPAFLYRMWQFYFAYCEGGFLERSIGLSQMVLVKPNFRGENL